MTQVTFALLTENAWPWAIPFLVLLAFLLYLAHRYEETRLPAARRSLDDMEAPMLDPMTPAQQDQQRDLVFLSTRMSGRRQERRDETATLARLYSFPSATRRVENIASYRPDPGKPAA